MTLNCSFLVSMTILMFLGGNEFASICVSFL